MSCVDGSFLHPVIKLRAKRKMSLVGDVFMGQI